NSSVLIRYIYSGLKDAIIVYYLLFFIFFLVIKNIDYSMNQLGPGIWYTIHRGELLIISDYDLASFKSYLVKVKDILPCETCRGHYQNEFDSRIGRMPSSYSSYKTSLTIFTLTVDMHNSVNSRLGKSQINQVEALAIYDID